MFVKVVFLSMAIVVIMFSSCAKSNDTSTRSEGSLKIGLIASYPFNGNANDESGNNYNGIVKGATLAADRFGNSNKAYNFNGIDARIEIPKLIATDSLQQFTISLWVKPTTPFTNANVILSFFNYDSAFVTNHFSLILDQGVYHTSNWFDPSPFGGYYSVVAIDSFPVPSGNWYHLVFVQDIKTSPSDAPFYQYYQYLNGTRSSRTFSSGPDLGFICLNNGGFIGADNNFLGRDRYFKGSIDDIRIYKRVLTDEEVRQLYNLQ